MSIFNELQRLQYDETAFFTRNTNSFQNTYFFMITRKK